MHQTIWIDIDIIVNSIASRRCCLCGLMSVMWRAQSALLGESASSCDFLYFRIFLSVFVIFISGASVGDVG